MKLTVFFSTRGMLPDGSAYNFIAIDKGWDVSRSTHLSGLSRIPIVSSLKLPG